jgi:hypothetical protein
VGFKKESQLVTITQQQLDDFAEAVANATVEKILAKMEAEGRLRPAAGSTLTIGAPVVDLAAHEATIDGDPLVMQPQQFRPDSRRAGEARRRRRSQGIRARARSWRKQLE